MIAASAALAVGGSLAVAGMASAAQIPYGSPSDTSGNTVYSVYNQSYAGLQNADTALTALGDTAVPQSTSFPAASALTAAQAQQIAADFTGQTINGTTPTAHTPSYATEAAGVDTTYSTDAPKVAAAGAGWASLSGLIVLSQDDPTDFPGGLYTMDGDLTLSSAATVTGVGKPTQYTETLSAPQGGYVIPSGFTLTFPASFTVNTKLVSDEIQPSQLASPPADKAIGTAVVTSPAIAPLAPGSKGVDSSAAVFVVANPNPALITQPSFELYLGQGNYITGTLSGVSFPLTVTFGLPTVGGAQVALPFSSISMTFPASSSPLQAKSCSNLGTLTGTATDAVAALAAQFGDTSDGYVNATTTNAVDATATPTAVTNECSALAAAAIHNIKKGKPVVRIRLRGNGGTPFTAETITLPAGIAARGLKGKDVKVAGAKLKRVTGHGRKVTLLFRRKTKAATVTFVKGLVATPKLRKAVAKHKTKALSISYTVRYAPAGAAAANSTVASVKIKHLS